MLADHRRLDESVKHGEAPDLSRTGEDLGHAIQVVLNTNDEDKRGNMEHIIRQPHLRRGVVVTLTLGAKTRGHRAYQHLYEQPVRAKAHTLPVNRLPPEHLYGLPDDKSLDNIQIPQTTTSSEGMHKRLERARDIFREQRPLAVVWRWVGKRRH